MNLPKAFEISELVKAAEECARGVKWKVSVTKFMNALFEKCVGLQRELMTGTYKLSNYSYFKVYEPKVRQISSQTFVDRIVQRSLCNNGVYDDLTRFLIYDNCACVKGKGTSFAINRLKCHMYRHYRKYGLSGYVIHIDIKRYFQNIPHGDIKRSIWQHVKEPVYRNELYRIIDSFKVIPTGRNFLREPESVGIPLGSQLSQLFALGELDPVDRFIKETLHIKQYLRYMDDLVMIVPCTFIECQLMLNRIVERIEVLGFEVNKKTAIVPFFNGVRFMHRVFSIGRHTGRLYINVDRSKISKEHRKLKAMLRLISRKGKFTINDLFVHYQGWRHYAVESGRYAIVRNMDDFLRDLIKFRPDFKRFVFEHKFDNIDPRIIGRFI